jgi:hypothetical protein
MKVIDRWICIKNSAPFLVELIPAFLATHERACTDEVLSAFIAGVIKANPPGRRHDRFYLLSLLRYWLGLEVLFPRVSKAKLLPTLFD